ncbi:MAG: hypothetical protein IT477_08840 [Rhodanobacteraceae bacterium]|nr:hypothetical protein [Rhodanobacteraceae bacterium]MCW5578171.1 hypothetical protein [Dokdonella sp.]MDL1869508.1 hypothetical protein [Gammaproteobacteria bacterium PRO6]
MTPRTRNRIGLILILVLFTAPLIAAWVLGERGWLPAGKRNYGTLIQPPRALDAARLVAADGNALAWRDPGWSWTVLALPGPRCAARCLARLDELRRVRVSLNQNATRVRLVLVGELASAELAALAPLRTVRDLDGALRELLPTAPDELAVAFVDPQGFLVLRYGVGYDARKLRKDLERVLKS